jgi:NAD(P)-dependent dehydrogenase (short-subunit alcohol dehydrogenase family)
MSHNPTVLIAGASRGLGLEFVRQYAADGWKVFSCCRSPENATALQAVAQANKAIQIEKLDVTDDASLAALAKKLEGMALDLLINSAGIFSSRPGLSASDEDETQLFGSIDSEGWMKVLRTNTIAPIMVAQAFRRNLVGGKIAILSSRMGSIGKIRRVGDIAYRSSKAGLNAAVKSISFDLKNQNAIVAALHPGFVKTDTGGSRAEISPEESVTAMRKIIASLQAENSGQFFNYDGQILPW